MADVLQVADEYDQSFRQLIDAYAQIAKHLPRFDRLLELYEHNDTFKKVVANVCCDILEFHRHAYEMLRRGGWKRLFDASWKNFRLQFDSLLARLKQGQDLVDREAASHEFAEAREFRQKMLDDLKRREKERDETQLRITLVWLGLEGHDRDQENLFHQKDSMRQPTTCEWILKNTKVRNWLDQDESKKYLWIKGKPGAGAYYLLCPWNTTH